MDFGVLEHLATLGLISFQSTGVLGRHMSSQKLTVRYGAEVFDLELIGGSRMLMVGKVSFTEAGQQLETLTQATIVPEFIDEIVMRWRGDGHKITLRTTSGSEGVKEALQRLGLDAWSARTQMTNGDRRPDAPHSWARGRFLTAKRKKVRNGSWLCENATVDLWTVLKGSGGALALHLTPSSQPSRA